MKLDTKLVSVVITANPHGLVAPELLLWLLDRGFTRENILISRGCDRDQAVAYNQAVALALGKRAEWFLFADCDIRPSELTDPLLEVTADFTCAMSESEAGLEAWGEPDSFHTALWVGRRYALERIAPPWFAWQLSPNGANIIGCVCRYFTAKARALGLTVDRRGFAKHYPRPVSTLPPMTWLGKCRAPGLVRPPLDGVQPPHEAPSEGPRA